MIVEIVTFTFPTGHDRASELEAVRGVRRNGRPTRTSCASTSCGVEAEGTGAGFYIWPSIEAAERAHGDEWREAVKKRTGGYPTIRYFDLLALVDNEDGTVTEWDENGKARDLTRKRGRRDFAPSVRNLSMLSPRRRGLHESCAQ